MTDNLTSSSTREQEAAYQIVEAWTRAIESIGSGKAADLAADAYTTTYAECARLADAIRGFIPKEQP